MRFHFWLVAVCAIVSTAAVTVVTATRADDPPPVRGDRSRPRLVKADWTVPAILFSPTDAGSAALVDAESLLAAAMVGFQYDGDLTGRDAAREAYEAKVRKGLLAHVRYLTCFNFPEAMRQGVWEDVSFVLNSLSQNDEIRPPVAGGPGSILIRVNLLDQDIDPDDWDKLGLTDPYFHVDVRQESTEAVEVEREYGHYEDASGKFVEADEGKKRADCHWVKVSVKKEKQDKKSFKSVRALNGCDPEVLKRLAFLLNSKAPLLRADWWIVNASTPPGYYDLLRVKNLKDAEDLAGFDQRAQDRKEIRATVVRSGSGGLSLPVARNNRILARTPTFQGYFWQTFDFLNSTAAKNVINNFLNIKDEGGRNFSVGEISGLRPKEWLRQTRQEKTNFRDAGEWIYSLPNGLQGYLLTDAKDNRLDEADIHVAFDSTSHDFRVVNGRSCIWCHTEGIRPFKSQFQLQVGARQLTDLGLYVGDDDEKALALADFIRRTFGAPEFDDVIRDDQAAYARAIAKVNGLTPERNAVQFRRHWDGYAETDLDMNHICFETGLQEAQVKSLITLRKDGVNNGVLLQQLLQPPIDVRRDQWEEVYPDVAALVPLLKK